MPTSNAEEYLSQYGVTFQQARQFIYDNLDSPQLIYQVAAQYSVSFDMLAELYGQEIDGDIVKNFFQGQGMVTKDDAPTWDSDYQDGDYDTMYGRLDLDIDDVLGLTKEELANADWDSLISQYNDALSDFNWDDWEEGITQALASVDWEAWAEKMNAFASSYANDASWLTQLSTLSGQFGSPELGTLFNGTKWDSDASDQDSSSDADDNSDADNHTSPQNDDGDDSAGNDDAGNTVTLDTDTLTNLAGSADISSLLNSEALQNLDWSTLQASLQNFDWQSYYEQLSGALSNDNPLFASLGIDVESLSSDTDWTEWYNQIMEALSSSFSTAGTDTTPSQAMTSHDNASLIGIIDIPDAIA